VCLWARPTPIVMETAAVSEGDAAGFVDLVVTDPEVRRGDERGCFGCGFDARVECFGGSDAPAGAMRSADVVVLDEVVEVVLDLGDRRGGGLAGQVALQRLVEAFDLSARLGVIWPRVLGGDAEVVELGLDRAAAVAGAGGGDGAVVGEQGGREPVCCCGFVEGGDDVAGLGRGERAGRDDQAGVVIDDVEDLHDRVAVEVPVGRVGLPAFVGQLGFEANERRAGPLVGLGTMKPRR